jgi:cytoskeletal protein CcmA (bactofilin family)
MHTTIKTASAAGQEIPHSSIPKSFSIRGEVCGREPTQIAGHIEGALNFEQGALTIEPGAVVIADVTAGELIVFGRLCGNARVGHLQIRSGGSLMGDVVANELTVDPRGMVRGRIDFSGANHAATIRAATILVVEDQPKIFSVVSGLQLNEFSILAASNANTAWSLFEGGAIALVIMDAATISRGKLGLAMKQARAIVPIVVLAENWSALENMSFADLLLAESIGPERLQVHLKALLHANRRQAA